MNTQTNLIILCSCKAAIIFIFVKKCWTNLHTLYRIFFTLVTVCFWDYHNIVGYINFLNIPTLNKILYSVKKYITDFLTDLHAFDISHITKKFNFYLIGGGRHTCICMLETCSLRRHIKNFINIRSILIVPIVLWVL